MVNKQVQLVFVYGSLKTGFNNYPKFIQPAIEQGKASFVGAARTTNDEFHMVLNDQAFFPCLYRVSRGDGYKVSGDVFNLDRDTIAALDAFERVADKLYVRGVLDVDLVDGERKGETVSCQVYFMSVHEDLARLERITEYTRAMNAKFEQFMANPPPDFMESILDKMPKKQQT